MKPGHRLVVVGYLVLAAGLTAGLYVGWDNARQLRKTREDCRLVLAITCKDGRLRDKAALLALYGVQERLRNLIHDPYQLRLATAKIRTAIHRLEPIPRPCRTWVAG